LCILVQRRRDGTHVISSGIGMIISPVTIGRHWNYIYLACLWQQFLATKQAAKWEAVAGNPRNSANFLIDSHLANVAVVGSSPITRSSKQNVSVGHATDRDILLCERSRSRFPQQEIDDPTSSDMLTA
jgi:hypothetical protein